MIILIVQAYSLVVLGCCLVVSFSIMHYEGDKWHRKLIALSLCAVVAIIHIFFLALFHK